MKLTETERAALAEQHLQSSRPDPRFGIAKRGKPTEAELRRESEINREPAEWIEGGVRKLPVRYE